MYYLAHLFCLQPNLIFDAIKKCSVFRNSPVKNNLFFSFFAPPAPLIHVFLTNKGNSVINITHICIYCHMDQKALSLSSLGNKEAWNEIFTFSKICHKEMIF